MKMIPAEAMTRLMSVADALAEAVTMDEVAEAIASVAIAALEADKGVLCLLSDNSEELRVVRCVGYPEDVARAWPHIPITTPMAIPDAVRLGKPITLGSWQERASRYPDFPHISVSGGNGALAAIPLPHRGRVIGALGLGFANDRSFDPDELALMLLIGQHCAAALERARLHDTLRTEIAERAVAEAALRQSEERMRLMLWATQDGVWDWEPEAGTVFRSARWKGMLGYHEDEIGNTFQEWSELVHPDDWPEVEASFQAYLEGEAPHYYREHRLRHRDGTYRRVLTRGMAVRDAKGRVTRVLGTDTDITERRWAEKSLRAAALRLEALIANIQAGVIVEDDAGQVVLTNQAFCDMMGLGVQSWTLAGANAVPLARRAALLFENPNSFLGRVLELRREQRPVQAEELGLSDGRVWERDYVPVFPRGSQREDSGSEGDGYGGHLWLLRDVTDRRRIEQQLRDSAMVLEFRRAELEASNAEMEKANAELGRANIRLKELATTDGLTGLLNQRVFGQRLLEEFLRARRYGEPLSLIVLDVDRFKTYNDSFGHLAGNAVLRSLAEVLREHARETDLVARFGSEEFALILPHTEVWEASALAERLRSALEATVWSALYPITASFGVCALTPEMKDQDALVTCADAAMYRAKAGGRNRVAQG